MEVKNDAKMNYNQQRKRVIGSFATKLSSSAEELSFNFARCFSQLRHELNAMTPLRVFYGHIWPIKSLDEIKSNWDQFWQLFAMIFWLSQSGKKIRRSFSYLEKIKGVSLI